MTTNLDLLQANFKALGTALAAAGAKSATITYEGRDDSGEVNDFSVSPDSADLGEVAYQQFSWTEREGESVKVPHTVTANFESALSDLMWDAIEITGHDGFENNEGGQGSLTVYASGFAQLVHSDNYEGDSETDNQTFTPAPHAASDSEVMGDGLTLPKDRDEAVENWLKEQVVPAYLKLKANAESALTREESETRLVARRFQRGSSLASLAAALREAGFKAVHGEYTGSGDSGDGFEIEYTPVNEGDELEPPGDVTYETVSSVWNAQARRSEEVIQETTADFESAFEDVVFIFVETVMGHRGWEINEGGGGQVTLSADGTLNIEHYDNGEESTGDSKSYKWNEELATEEEQEAAEERETEGE